MNRHLKWYNILNTRTAWTNDTYHELQRTMVIYGGKHFDVNGNDIKYCQFMMDVRNNPRFFNLKG